jgi:hypothetical protein
MLSDDDLRSLSRDELDDLRRRLTHVAGDMPSLTAGNQRRRRFVVVMTIATLGLIPWVIVLAVTLPKHYIAGHWTLTWVGFDLGLLTSLGLTAYMAWRRRQAVIGRFPVSRDADLRRMVRHHNIVGTSRRRDVVRLRGLGGTPPPGGP